MSLLGAWHQRHGLPAPTYQLLRRAELQEGWLRCPFDPAHTVPPDRYRAHLQKCRMSHDPQGLLRVCPFDEAHIVNKVRGGCAHTLWTGETDMGGTPSPRHTCRERGWSCMSSG